MGCRFIAGRTRQFVTETVEAASRRDDPRTVGPGRIVADVLVVAALQFGDPILVLVLMKSDDFAFRHGGDSLADPQNT
jgi:hypothetical protein